MSTNIRAILAMLVGVGICSFAGGINGAIAAIVVLVLGLLVIRMVTWRQTP